MAFLDETGLAELWKLIKAEDASTISGSPKIETGSYTGTGYNDGEHGTSVTLNFRHSPFAVLISTTNSYPQTQVLVRGSTRAGGDAAQNGNVTTTLTWGEKSLVIKTDYYKVAAGFNVSGHVYNYYAMYLID